MRNHWGFGMSVRLIRNIMRRCLECIAECAREHWRLWRTTKEPSVAVVYGMRWPLRPSVMDRLVSGQAGRAVVAPADACVRMGRVGTPSPMAPRVGYMNAFSNRRPYWPVSWRVARAYGPVCAPQHVPDDGALEVEPLRDLAVGEWDGSHGGDDGGWRGNGSDVAWSEFGGGHFEAGGDWDGPVGDGRMAVELAGECVTLRFW